MSDLWFVQWLPGGVTSYLHMLVNKPFKDHLKQLHSEWLSTWNILTPTGTVKQSNTELLSQYIKIIVMDLSRSGTWRILKCCVSEQVNVEETGNVGCEYECVSCECETKKKWEIIRIVNGARLMKETQCHMFSSINFPSNVLVRVQNYFIKFL
jgi:hypothetical protein